MLKRLFDILVSVSAIIITFPIFIIAAIGIKLSSPGPIFYHAERIGIDRKTFHMFKFRSMHVSNGGSVITSSADRRVFKFGKIIRQMKIDELPQFLNVVIGDMSIVGPRPEAKKIVDEAYTDWMMETLKVKPGITSPGAIFYYAKGENLISNIDPEKSYLKYILVPKLAVERSYINRANFKTDLIVIFQTAWAILAKIFKFKISLPETDIENGKKWSQLNQNLNKTD